MTNPSHLSTPFSRANRLTCRGAHGAAPNRRSLMTLAPIHAAEVDTRISPAPKRAVRRDFGDAARCEPPTPHRFFFFFALPSSAPYFLRACRFACLALALVVLELLATAFSAFLSPARVIALKPSTALQPLTGIFVFLLDHGAVLAGDRRRHDQFRATQVEFLACGDVRGQRRVRSLGQHRFERRDRRIGHRVEVSTW